VKQEDVSQVAHLKIDSSVWEETHPDCMRCCMGFISKKEMATHIEESHPEVIISKEGEGQ